jgi:hypothetical protein
VCVCGGGGGELMDLLIRGKEGECETLNYFEILSL